MSSCNIALTLAQAAEKFPDRIALIVPRNGKVTEWTFAELWVNSRRFAGILAQQGVQRGDRVMLMVRPSMEFVCLTFALFQLGAVVILIDPGMGYRNLLRCIASVRPEVFVGIPRAYLFHLLCRRTFATVRRALLVGGPFSCLRPSRRGGKDIPSSSPPCWQASRDDQAAIIFTTGSTGPPKGVIYTHGIFFAQLDYIRSFYRITAYDRDQPAFPLFALFSTALGACAVIPEMDPSRPARVDPRRFIGSIEQYAVSYSFGSPAIWNVVSRYCLAHGIRLGIRKVLMAGAPVSGELVERVRAVIDPGGEVHTPYGATESLPIASIESREILAETWPLTRQGRGTCVGRPLPGIDIRIIKPVEGAVADAAAIKELGLDEIGEIIVRGRVVTRAYDGNDTETSLAKIADGDSFWHRMGDMGYLDDKGRLWFCGRKAHRVLTTTGVLYSVCCEAIFNEHPLVFRSALVGIGTPGAQTPVVIVEPREKITDTGRLLGELAELAGRHPLTTGISEFFVHPSFPVDIRHNAKIFREQLAGWAERQLKEKK